MYTSLKDSPSLLLQALNPEAAGMSRESRIVCIPSKSSIAMPPSGAARQRPFRIFSERVDPACTASPFYPRPGYRDAWFPILRDCGRNPANPWLVVLPIMDRLVPKRLRIRSTCLVSLQKHCESPDEFLLEFCWQIPVMSAVTRGRNLPLSSQFRP